VSRLTSVYGSASNDVSVMQVELGWASPLCASLQYYWDLITPGLAAEVQQELSRSLISRLLYRIEGILKGKKFTALGGLLLDRYDFCCSLGCLYVYPKCLRYVVHSKRCRGLF
jgi:hypothetical protein